MENRLQKNKKSWKKIWKVPLTWIASWFIFPVLLFGVTRGTIILIPLTEDFILQLVNILTAILMTPYFLSLPLLTIWEIVYGVKTVLNRKDKKSSGILHIVIGSLSLLAIIILVMIMIKGIVAFT